MRDFTPCLGWIVAAIALSWAASATVLGLVAEDPPTCHEDDVVAWDGDAHTICVPIDDLFDPARTVTFGELVAELGEATE